MLTRKTTMENAKHSEVISFFCRVKWSHCQDQTPDLFDVVNSAHVRGPIDYARNLTAEH